MLILLELNGNSEAGGSFQACLLWKQSKSSKQAERTGKIMAVKGFGCCYNPWEKD